MKTLVLKSPEYIFIILFILAGYSPPFEVNPLFLVITALLVLQIIFKNRISGFILGTLFSIGSVFFLLALLSEFHEFTEWNTNAMTLLFVGLLIWILTMALSLTMVYRYTKRALKVD